jgi:hypothetical protein
VARSLITATFRRIGNAARRLYQDERGQTATEYVAVLVVAVGIAGALLVRKLRKRATSRPMPDNDAKE